VILEHILRRAFSLAHRRIGLLFLDIFWKGIWTALTAGALFVFMLWFVSDLQSIEWQPTPIPGLNALIASAILREFWSANRAEILTAGFALLLFSAGLWVFLEAYCRRKIVRGVSSYETGATAPATHPLNIFVASGLIKNTLLLVIAYPLLAVWLAGAPAIAIVTFLSIGFFVTVADTLLRADAIELLGTDLIRVAGLLGILMSFEGMIVSSFIILLVTAVSNVSGQGGAITLAAAGGISLVLLAALHSYLLLVRFSAIAIMRKNVVEV